MTGGPKLNRPDIVGAPLTFLVARLGWCAMELFMPFWQRLLITLVAMLAVSFVAGFLWNSIFSFGLPSYAAGVVGGLTALPVWEFLKRIRARP